jgi:MFS family permease
MEQLIDPAPGSIRRWGIFVIASINFVISMFYRVSTAVISPALVRDLELTSEQLGDLSAAFYYAFAFAQLPVGISIDRMGCRVTMAILSVAAVGGAILFSVGQTPGHLIMARILLGIGMSGNFMVALTLLAGWFPVNRFASLSGMTVAVGTLGNLLATTPLTLLTMSIGWRGSFWLFAKVNLAVVLLFLLITRDHPPGHTSVSWRPQSVTAGVKLLLGMYSYWAISLSNFVRYGYIAALQSLWAFPFLIYGLGWSELAASNAILFLGLGYMVGFPTTGFISDRVIRSRKGVALPGTVAFSLITLSIAWWTHSTPFLFAYVSFFCLGLTAAAGQILYAHMKELMPSSMIAQAMTSVNLFTILGAGVMTHVLSVVVGSEPSKLAGPGQFLWLWYIGAIGLAVTGILYSVVPDSRALKGGGAN